MAIPESVTRAVGEECTGTAGDAGGLRPQFDSPSKVALGTGAAGGNSCRRYIEDDHAIYVAIIGGF